MNIDQLPRERSFEEIAAYVFIGSSFERPRLVDLGTGGKLRLFKDALIELLREARKQSNHLIEITSSSRITIEAVKKSGLDWFDTSFHRITGSHVALQFNPEKIILKQGNGPTFVFLDRTWKSLKG